ncbi:hypothetical protein Goshw_019846, partial [Gossypium schwendimanii]|nr:hypothetical protein [Gossypium schwendimanii]
RVGRGDQISVWDDLWISRNEADIVPNQDNNENIKLVSDLIDSTNRSWKTEVVRDTFRMDVAEKILQIPLAEIAHEDFQYGGSHGISSRPLSTSNSSGLWWKLNALDVVMKKKITVIFFNNALQQLRFGTRTNEQIRLFYCGLWLIWFRRNQFLYERRYMTGTEIVRKIWNYIAELEAINKKKLKLHSTRNIQHVYRRGRVTLHFDTAFDCQSSRSATGLIVWNEEGGILASQAVIHSDIANPFTTEAYAGLQAVKLGISMGLNKM